MEKQAWDTENGLMNEFNAELDSTIKRYKHNISTHGFTSAGMGWGHKDRQKERFEHLIKPWEKYKPASILDVGCGLCDMYEFCKEYGLEDIHYTGIEVVPDTYEHINKVYSETPDVEIFNTDVESYISRVEGKQYYDIATFSGVFNKKFDYTDNLNYVKKILNKCIPLLRYGLSINFLAGTADKKEDNLFYMDYEDAIQMAIQMGNRFIVDKSYMQFEYTLHIFSDLSTDERNVFNG